MIHELARPQEDRSRPKPEEQTVPGFSGFHANMSEPVEKSCAIYHVTYPNPPSKTILYDVMCKLIKSIAEKKMPFAVIVGDQPVYVLMLELKSENAAYEALMHHALDKRLDSISLSEEVKALLAKLRCQNSAQDEELAKAYIKLENNAELKNLVDTLFKDCEEAP